MMTSLLSILHPTGGPDCILRLWGFVAANRPTTILGHHDSGIMHVFMQDGGARVYSMDRKKVFALRSLSSAT
jgi:hypothetical protein